MPQIHWGAPSLLEGLHRGRHIAGEKPRTRHCQHRLANQVVATCRTAVRGGSLEKRSRFIDRGHQARQLAQTLEQNRPHII